MVDFCFLSFHNEWLRRFLEGNEHSSTSATVVITNTCFHSCPFGICRRHKCRVVLFHDNGNNHYSLLLVTYVNYVPIELKSALFTSQIIPFDLL